jgi:hypothetical protein
MKCGRLQDVEEVKAVYHLWSEMSQMRTEHKSGENDVAKWGMSLSFGKHHGRM